MSLGLSPIIKIRLNTKNKKTLINCIRCSRAGAIFYVLCCHSSFVTKTKAGIAGSNLKPGVIGVDSATSEGRDLWFQPSDVGANLAWWADVSRAITDPRSGPQTVAHRESKRWSENPKIPPKVNLIGPVCAHKNGSQMTACAFTYCTPTLTHTHTHTLSVYLEPDNISATWSGGIKTPTCICAPVKSLLLFYRFSTLYLYWSCIWSSSTARR